MRGVPGSVCSAQQKRIADNRRNATGLARTVQRRTDGPMDITRRVLVVGGGVAGLAAAVRLARSGARVTVIEQAPEFGEIGAGLQLGPNATRLLDEWDLLDEVR